MSKTHTSKNTAASRSSSEPTPPRVKENSISAASDSQPLEDARRYLTQYSREKPEMCALVCLAVGFVLGWKLKPW